VGQTDRRYHDATTRADESALPAVGVMDMLVTTPPQEQVYDYGTAQDSKEMFSYIKGYSPYTM
jgi:hypothetical protein